MTEKESGRQMWFANSYPPIIWWGEFRYSMCTLTQSLTFIIFELTPLIFPHLLPWDWLLSKYTQGQVEQILPLAAANSYRASVLLSYFSVNQNLKGLKMSCSRHFGPISGQPSKQICPQCFSHNKLQQWQKRTLGYVFVSSFPERNPMTNDAKNPQWTKSILKSAKSTSGDEIQTLIHTMLAPLPVCEL